jgi:hypothetical protein
MLLIAVALAGLVLAALCVGYLAHEKIQSRRAYRRAEERDHIR